MSRTARCLGFRSPVFVSMSASVSMTEHVLFHKSIPVSQHYWNHQFSVVCLPECVSKINKTYYGLLFNICFEQSGEFRKGFAAGFTQSSLFTIKSLEVIPHQSDFMGICLGKPIFNSSSNADQHEVSHQRHQKIHWNQHRSQIGAESASKSGSLSTTSL